jgi:hypothetical protein
VVSAEERSEVWMASFPKARELPLLDGSTTWWRFFMRLSAEYGHLSAMIAGDFLIQESERRLAAVLLKFGGFRVLGNPGVDDVSAMAPVLVPVTQAELPAAANLSRKDPAGSWQVKDGRNRVSRDYDHRSCGSAFGRGIARRLVPGKGDRGARDPVNRVLSSGFPDVAKPDLRAGRGEGPLPALCAGSRSRGD